MSDGWDHLTAFHDDMSNLLAVAKDINPRVLSVWIVVDGSVPPGVAHLHATVMGSDVISVNYDGEGGRGFSGLARRLLAAVRNLPRQWTEKEIDATLGITRKETAA